MKTKTKTIFLISCVLFSLAFASCNDEEQLSKEDQLQADIELIEKYGVDNDLDFQKTESGIHYIITEEGTADQNPGSNATVEVLYKGYFIDGEVFDQTTGNNTATFGLGQVIEGWQEAIPLLNKKGKGTFVMPSELCYGSSGAGGIPPNTVLIFDIELIDFE